MLECLVIKSLYTRGGPFHPWEALSKSFSKFQVVRIQGSPSEASKLYNQNGVFEPSAPLISSTLYFSALCQETTFLFLWTQQLSPCSVQRSTSWKHCRDWLSQILRWLQRFKRTVLRICFQRFFKKIFFLRFYLFLERGEGRKRGRETSVYDCLLHTPYWRLGPQPRHVPWLGVEAATLWFTGWHSTHWATPARVCF